MKRPFLISFTLKGNKNGIEPRRGHVGKADFVSLVTRDTRVRKKLLM